MTKNYITNPKSIKSIHVPPVMEADVMLQKKLDCIGRDYSHDIRDFIFQRGFYKSNGRMRTLASQIMSMTLYKPEYMNELAELVIDLINNPNYGEKFRDVFVGHAFYRTKPHVLRTLINRGIINYKDHIKRHMEKEFSWIPSSVFLDIMTPEDRLKHDVTKSLIPTFDPKNPPDFNHICMYGCMPNTIYSYIREDNLPAFCKLMENKFLDFNLKFYVDPLDLILDDRKGRNMLEFAAYCNSYLIFHFLLLNGAQPTELSLESAIADGPDDIRKLLLNFFDYKPYMAEVAMRHHSNGVLDQICRKYKVTITLNDCLFSQNFEAFLYFVENGAAIDQPDLPEKRVLTTAVQIGIYSIVEWLLDNGAQINTKTYTCRFDPLNFACLYGHADIVRLLLERGANANQELNGRTPLISACMDECEPETLELLMQYGADVNYEDYEGDYELLKKTPKDEMRNGQRWIHFPTALAHAALLGHPDGIRFLLAHGATVHGYVTPMKDTILHFAVQSDNTEAVKILIDAGATVVDPNSNNLAYNQAKSDAMRKTLLNYMKVDPRVMDKARKGGEQYPRYIPPSSAKPIPMKNPPIIPELPKKKVTPKIEEKVTPENEKKSKIKINQGDIHVIREEYRKEQKSQKRVFKIPIGVQKKNETNEKSNTKAMEQYSLLSKLSPSFNKFMDRNVFSNYFSMESSDDGNLDIDLD